MFVRGFAFCGVYLAMLISCGALGAQTAPAPTAYTVTVTNSVFGPGELMKTYRLGSKVLVDQISAANATDPKASHTRSLYDLATHKSLSWSWPDSSAGCGTGTFSGDWGDPFAGAGDVSGQGARQVGAETLHGMAARIMETSNSGTRIRAWVDTKFGMVLKAQMSQQGGALKTVVEVTDISLAPPPASIFNFPASCAAAAAAPPPPTEAEKIAALTGGGGQDFLNGIYGPGSKNSCTMVLRVVHAGTMEPITSGFQVAVDLNVATEPTPSYNIGMSTNGHATFSGGGLHEITSPTHNGVFRIDNIPAQFDMDIEFGNGGSGTANVYRQCFAPQTVLLYVVKNPAHLSDGAEPLWVKAGKYATVPN